ncbi:MAG: FAD-dependent oxidoreductase [Chloroflexota bacterium]
MKIAVIGGGVLGMAAAYELLKRGQQVALYERAPVLGGQVRTFDVGGGRLECFYHHLFTSDVDMIDLIHDLGLGDNLTWIPSRMGFFHGGRIHNFVTPMDLLRFSPISIVDRVRLGLLALYLGRFSDWEKLEGIPAQEWINRYAGRRISDVVWGPLLRGKFGDAAREVGMVWFWGKVFLRFSSRKGGRETLGYPVGSFGRVVEALERRIRAMGGEVHAPAQINRIVVEDGRGADLGSEAGVFEPTRKESVLVPRDRIDEEPSGLLQEPGSDGRHGAAAKLLLGGFEVATRRLGGQLLRRGAGR